MKIGGIKTTSVGFGAGNAKAQPARIAMPTTSRPDRVNPDAQHNIGQELKAGIKGAGTNFAAGRKAK
jgi:hypothetical protein